ncbi:hypothetical protein Pcinc_018946 [Petrolisthes cinctipes]|uniref:Uncharacterized protein n=1 Tax=Petrolisthes cinctipes TaxID=88211 RepID=A0AAE1FLV4_PETCI|nr:hypothetical protein Pcinc_018946 [Petrolisthes cinctipes]
MRSGKKLRGTNIYVNEDLCAASQATKNAQMPLLKAARAQGKVAFFRHTKLIIKEKMSGGADGWGQRSTVSVGGCSVGGASGAAAGGGAVAGAAAVAGGAAAVVDAAATGGGVATGGSVAAGDAAVAGDAAASGDVVCVEVAGVWSGGDDARPSLPSSQPGGSRARPTSSSSASASVVPSPQRKEVKKLRSATKK